MLEYSVERVVHSAEMSISCEKYKDMPPSLLSLAQRQEWGIWGRWEMFSEKKRTVSTKCTRIVCDFSKVDDIPRQQAARPL